MAKRGHMVNIDRNPPFKCDKCHYQSGTWLDIIQEVNFFFQPIVISSLKTGPYIGTSLLEVNPNQHSQENRI